MPTYIISFGYRHGKPPQGFKAIDVRKWLKRNPFHKKHLRNLRGTDPEVQEDIRQTPDFDKSYQTILNMVKNETGVVFIGCTGGHHRSVYIAELLSKDLGVPVRHSDIHNR